MKNANLMVVAILGALAFGVCTPTSLQAGRGKSKQASKAKKSSAPVKVKRHTPPPKAPAHGYRYKHSHGVELTFDSGLGAYAVNGKPGIYYHNGLYVKLSGGVWRVTTHFDGIWRLPKDAEVPINLKKIKVAKLARKAKVHPGKGKKK